MPAPREKLTRPIAQELPKVYYDPEKIEKDRKPLFIADVTQGEAVPIRDGEVLIAVVVKKDKKIAYIVDNDPGFRDLKKLASRGAEVKLFVVSRAELEEHKTTDVEQFVKPLAAMWR